MLLFYSEKWQSLRLYNIAHNIQAMCVERKQEFSIKHFFIFTSRSAMFVPLSSYWHFAAIITQFNVTLQDILLPWENDFDGVSLLLRNWLNFTLKHSQIKVKTFLLRRATILLIWYLFELFSDFKAIEIKFNRIILLDGNILKRLEKFSRYIEELELWLN